jgi:hypothetical protein
MIALWVITAPRLASLLRSRMAQRAGAVIAVPLGRRAERTAVVPNTANEDRLYTEIESRRVNRDAGLPSYEELGEAVSALGAVEEFLAGPIAEAVIRVANTCEPSSFSYEDVARLIFYADHMREQADSIVDAAAKVAHIAHFVFPQVDGYSGDPTEFKDNGRPEDRAKWDAWKRSNGFGGRNAC